MSGDWALYLPIWLSVLSVLIWLLVLGGIADHWRTRHPVPSGVVAALLLVVVGAVLTRLAGAPYYIDPANIPTATLGGHVQRALLVTTGLYALALLVRSRLRW